jgi:hypothetical protein
MIREIILATAITAIVCSYQKCNTNTITSVKPDTSYLLKTATSYYYNAAGNILADSSQEKWTYDAQNRPARIVRLYPNGMDTASYGVR